MHASLLWLRAIALLLCLVLAGCTTLQQISPIDAGQLNTQLKPGDALTCTLRDGSSTQLTYQTIDGDALVAKDGHRVPIAEIAQIEVKRTDVTRTVLLSLAIAAGVIGIAAAAGGGGGSSSGGGGY